MQLAHFIQRYPPALGGSEAYFARLSQFCARQGDDVTVITSNALALESFWSNRQECLQPGIEMDAGVTVVRHPLWRFPGRRWLLKPLSLIPHRAWQCLTMPCNPIAKGMWNVAGDFDAVHATAFPYAFPVLCARRLARRLRIPFFITPFLHLGDPADPHNATRRAYTSAPLGWLLKEADAIFVQTPSERDLALALGLAADKVILQGLGVEPGECTGGHRAGARHRWNLPAEGVVVGHLANNSWEKGTNDLLDALEPLWRQGKPIHLLLAGPRMPNFTSYWQRFVERCPEFVRTWIRQLGPITDEEKRDFFAAIDLFALPSRSDSFGLVLLEAWANGVPSVAYRAGGIADVIHDQQDGLLVRCGDLGELSAAIARLTDKETTCRHFGENGRQRLATEFRWRDKLELVRAVIAERIKKTRTEWVTRTLPALQPVLRPE